MAVTGLHHVTVISGRPQENLDFYVRVLGMRLVKRTVNQDVPDTYHFFFADGAGTPGTELTFFPWPDLPRGRHGPGITNEVSLAVPPDSLHRWAERLAEHGVTDATRHTRFGEPTLTFTDPHGVAIALVETADARDFTPWPDSPVPAEQQIRGLHAVRVDTLAAGLTERFLADGLGFAFVAEEGGRRRHAVAGGGSGRFVDVVETPGARRGTWGVGSVHHVAFRVPDDAAEAAAQRQVQAAGVVPTPVVDRFWFRSVYFKEPGGALFEIATDIPGFTVDEDAATLGSRLILPPFLEPRRREIEAALPPVTTPVPAGALG